MEALFAWVEEQHTKVLPKSPLGVAVGYARGNREALMRYTEAGFSQIDNNASERALRAVAVGRKNYPFAGSDVGGRPAGVSGWTRSPTSGTPSPDSRRGRVEGLLPAPWAAEQSVAAP